MQKIVDSFWRRRTRDTFPSLVQRKKWDAQKRNVRVDNVINVSDSNAVRESYLPSGGLKTKDDTIIRRGEDVLLEQYLHFVLLHILDQILKYHRIHKSGLLCG